MVPNFPHRTELTRRHLQVVDCLVHGMTNKETARELNISPRTVEDYRLRVFHTLGVHNCVELTRHVYQIGDAHAHEPL